MLFGHTYPNENELANKENSNFENSDCDINNSTSDESSDIMSEDDFNINKIKGKLELYKNAKLKLGQFITLFCALVDKLALAESHRRDLLEFIRILIPDEINLPDSYNLILKSLKKPDISSFILCKRCGKEINFSQIKGVKLKKMLIRRLRCLWLNIEIEWSNSYLYIEFRIPT